LNRRPLGYEPSRGLVGNPLISRRMSRTMSNSWFLADGPSYLSFEDGSWWYGSKTGADGLWVQPKTRTVRTRQNAWRTVAVENRKRAERNRYGLRSRCQPTKLTMPRPRSSHVAGSRLLFPVSENVALDVGGALPPTMPPPTRSQSGSKFMSRVHSRRSVKPAGKGVPGETIGRGAESHKHSPFTVVISTCGTKK
jgi:hypothetical protein